MENKTPEKNEAASFGGGESRLIYEGKNKKTLEKLLYLVIIIVGIAIAFLTVVGVISIANGSLSSIGGTGSDSESIKIKSGAASQQSIAASVAEAASRVSVVITIEQEDGKKSRQSGFFISSNGYIATELTPQIQTGTVESATIYYGEGYENVPIIYNGCNYNFGIAYYHIEPYSIFSPNPHIANSSFVKPGQEVFAVPASSNDFYGLMTHGIVSNVYKDTSVCYPDEQSYTMIYADFLMNSTLPGCPVLNSDGEIIGMCSRYAISAEKNITAIIPINMVLTLGNGVLN